MTFIKKKSDTQIFYKIKIFKKLFENENNYKIGSSKMLVMLRIPWTEYVVNEEVLKKKKTEKDICI